MKTDKFMQGILVSDNNDDFRYTYSRSDQGLNQVVNRLKKIKKNLTSLKYFTHNSQPLNRRAVFSKTYVKGSVDEAITDVWDRLRFKHDPSEDL